MTRKFVCKMCGKVFYLASHTNTLRMYCERCKLTARREGNRRSRNLRNGQIKMGGVWSDPVEGVKCNQEKLLRYYRYWEVNKGGGTPPRPQWCSPVRWRIFLRYKASPESFNLIPEGVFV